MSQLTLIERLNKDNYESWKIQIEAVLIKNDHWSFVDGQQLKPEEGSEDETKWIKDDLKARSDIILSVNPSELSHIKHCETSREVWLKLKSVYESSGPAKKATLLKQLLFKKMTADESMMEHLTAMFEIIDKLNEVQIEIADDLLSILMLYSIPDRFENFRCAIESRDQLPKPENLKIKMIEEYESRQNIDSRDSQNAYFTAKLNKDFNVKKSGNFPKNKRTNQNNRYRQNQAKYIPDQRKYAMENRNYMPEQRNYSNLRCNYCFISGHKASVCRKRLADQENKRSHHRSSMASDCSLAVNDAQNRPTNWCLDSGCTSHMCKDKNSFTEFYPRQNSTIQLAVAKTADIIGIGTVPITVVNGDKIKTVSLKNVLCVPELKCNLISTSKATIGNRSVIFNEKYADIIESDGSIILRAVRQGDLYYVQPRQETAAIAEVSELLKWHLRLGHLNEFDLRKLRDRNMVRNLNFKNNDSIKDCKVCIQSKQTVRPFPKTSRFRSKVLLQVIHSDLCGSMRVKSHAGSKYFATFIDDKSRYMEVYFLKTKDEVRSAFIKFKSVMENRIGKKIKTLRTDNGKEYRSQNFDKYLEECGIRREFSAPLTPQQNSVAERANRTLTEMARCLLLQSNLPETFWAEAINCAAYIRNRCPSRSLNENKTPYECFFGVKPTVSYFKIFGQKCFVLNKNRNKGKFEPRSEEHIFVGYSNESKAYRVWNTRTRKVVISRDVKFINEFESSNPPIDNLNLIFPFPKDKENNTDVDIEKITSNTPSNSSINAGDEEGEGEGMDDENEYEDNENEYEDNTQNENECEHEIDVVNSQDEDEEINIESEPEPIKIRAPGRPRKVKTGKKGRPRKEYKYRLKIPPLEEKSQQKSQIVVEETCNLCPELSEVLHGPFKREWAEAIELEFNSLSQQNAWQIVDRPINKKVIGCRWVLKTKYKPDGSVEKLKARLVAKGCCQRHGIDYEEIYSPVARLSSIRTAIAYGIENGFTAYQLDFIMAYINGDLDEEIFMEMPDGFKEDENENKVCLLKKSLYGLKQSGRQWFKKLDEKLKFMKFESINADKCVYISKSNIEAIIIVYVDDLIILTKSKSDYENIKEELSKSFKMKDLGLLHYCLGIEFMQNGDNIVMKQKKYIGDILSKFNMQEAKPMSTPMDGSLKLTKDMCPKTQEEKSEMNKIPYRQLIGSLMYLSVATRPDITHAVNFLSQFNDNPGKAHWVAAKRVLRYLKGTENQGLHFKRSGQPLTAFVDADWASDLNDRKSFTGYMFKFANGPVSWESRKQRTVALSTTEAEYLAMSEAAKEALHLRRFMNEISSKKDDSPTLILCDNQSAQKLVRNPVYHSRTKHIDIRHHFIREIYNNGEIDLKYLKSEEMPADILTKALCGNKHKKCCTLMGMKS